MGGSEEIKMSISKTCKWCGKEIVNDSAINYHSACWVAFQLEMNRRSKKVVDGKDAPKREVRKWN